MRCSVPGCPGTLRHATNGNGAVHDSCDCCEKRAEWERKNKPSPPTHPCLICGGLVIGRQKRCDACEAAVKRVSVAKSTAKKRHGATAMNRLTKLTDVAKAT